MTNSKPEILVFVGDLIFLTRIESAAEAMGYEIRVIERAEQIAPFDPTASPRQPAEHLEGRGAVLIDKVSSWRPALMIFDLNNDSVPWERWIAWLRSAPATRRIPVLSFGSHMDVQTMKRAKAVGSTEVAARSRFVRELSNLIEKHARVPDHEGIRLACEGELSDLALEGLRLYNEGDYFEAHELLEDAWNEDESPAKELYRAILQVAVMYLQIERENYRGAVKMALRSRQWMAPLPDKCRGVDVAQLRLDARRVEEALHALGEERIGEFDRSLFKPVQFTR